MCGGRQQRVSILFINPLLDTAIERFGTGKDVFYRPEDEKHFVVTADLEISDQFYGWLCGFGKRVKILSPATAAEEYKAYLEKISTMY